jgi:hypothetical protein
LPHHKLEEALREQKVGCAVCRLVDRTGRRYLESLLYEDVNDPGVQSGFRGSLGFCPRHAHLMLDAGDGLGTAILYRAATQELLQTLSRVPDTPKSRTPLRSLLGRPSKEELALPEPGRGCMLCPSEARAEEIYLRALLDGAEAGEFDGLLDGPGAVCVRHLSKASALAGGWLPRPYRSHPRGPERPRSRPEPLRPPQRLPLQRRALGQGARLVEAHRREDGRAAWARVSAPAWRTT